MSRSYAATGWKHLLHRGLEEIVLGALLAVPVVGIDEELLY